MSKIVTAVGVSVNSERHGAEAARRIQDAINAEIRQCLADGLTTEEKDAPAMRARMLAAQERVLADIAEGR